MAENTTAKKSPSRGTRKKATTKKKVEKQDVNLMQELDENGQPVHKTPKMEVTTTDAKEPVDIDKPMTMEEMLKDEETQKNIRNLAAEIDSALPDKWINYARYSRYFKGVKYEAFLQIVNILRVFGHAVVKKDERSGETKMRIDFTKEIELQLIEDDIAVHKAQIEGLTKRKKVVQKQIKEIAKQKKKDEEGTPAV